MDILAIIPARGGSKGLPGKNIRPLAGHPLIAYSVEAAKRTKSITRIICSTDDAEIAAVAKLYGAEIPFMRPAHLAEDMSTDLEVFEHLLQTLETTEGYVPSLVVQFRPTSPIRQVADIEACIEMMVANSDADSLRIITESPNTPYKMWRLANDNSTPYLLPILPAPPGYPEPYNEPRQRLPKTYWHTGTLDVIRTETITKLHSMSGKKILPYKINSELALDIDYLASFNKAEEILAAFPDVVHF